MGYNLKSVSRRVWLAGLWTLQAEEGMGRLFSNSLPIADGDHALHHVSLLLLSVGCSSFWKHEHCFASRSAYCKIRNRTCWFLKLTLPRNKVMEEIPVAFPEWQEFKDTLSAMTKAFGSYHRLDRFRDVCINKNRSVPQDSCCQKLAGSCVFFAVRFFICI